MHRCFADALPRLSVKCCVEGVALHLPKMSTHRHKDTGAPTPMMHAERPATV
jgi:hypothetical protein